MKQHLMPSRLAKVKPKLHDDGEAGTRDASQRIIWAGKAHQESPKHTESVPCWHSPAGVELQGTATELLKLQKFNLKFLHL